MMPRAVSSVLFRTPAYTCMCRSISGADPAFKRHKPLEPVLKFDQNPPDVNPDNPYILGKKGELKHARSPSHAMDQITIGDYHLQNTDDPKYQKTTVSVLQDEMAEVRVLIEAYNEAGFRMNDSRFLVGPICVFPRIALSWKLLTVNDITEESVQVFGMIEPKPEVVIIGAGETSEETDAIRARVFPFFQKLRIGCEVLQVDKAATTFNFLNAEKRLVAGLFFPVKPPGFVSEFYEDFDTTKYRRPFDQMDDPIFGTGAVGLSQISERIMNKFGVGSKIQLKKQEEEQQKAAKREQQVQEKLGPLAKQEGEKDSVK